MFKKCICVISAFSILFLSFFSSFSAYASPTNLPEFECYPPTFPISHYDVNYTLYPYANILCYDTVYGQYLLFTYATTYDYLNSGYLTIEYDETVNLSGQCYKFTTQDHLSSNTKLYISYSSGDNNQFYIDSTLWNWGSSISFYENSFDPENPYNNNRFYIDEQNNPMAFEILASDVDLKDEDGNIIYFGSRSSFCNLFSAEHQPPINEFADPVEPPTQPPTLSPAENSAEQVKTSKNILENVKSLLTSVVNLPSNIANSIRGFFSDLLAGIVSVGESIVNGILDALKYLFIPSGTVFTNIQTLIEDKFGFIYQIIDLGLDIVNITFSDEAPEFLLEFENGTVLSLVDWELFDEYRTFIHGLIVAVAYGIYIPKLIKRIPSIIRGI